MAMRLSTRRSIPDCADTERDERANKDMCEKETCMSAPSVPARSLSQRRSARLAVIGRLAKRAKQFGEVNMPVPICIQRGEYLVDASVVLLRLQDAW